jgi:hypothetical protein
VFCRYRAARVLLLSMTSFPPSLLSLSLQPVRIAREARQFLVDPATGMHRPCQQYPNCAHCPMALSGGGVDVVTGAPQDAAHPCRYCGAHRMTLYEVPTNMLEPPDVCTSDFDAVLQRSRVTVAADELQQYADWTGTFGEEG